MFFALRQNALRNQTFNWGQNWGQNSNIAKAAVKPITSKRSSINSRILTNSSLEKPEYRFL
ncbi:hypothetical protein KDH_43500 [Dictyobacter sp. S3.2.2.5]|uniref:Uncharacterized protein n=1 Tax=Dictyobacter halimunensis TaxID=3026934 RepID=A0ABQ6FYE1_9CHLR|nr:hypothetical protein KDH_43500 [Dictyobacter sp. S3.2.2.5]